MFAKLKQFVGIVGVTVQLDIKPELSYADSDFDGVIRITAKQDQHITSVKLAMKQVHQEGSGSERTSREFEIGHRVVVAAPFDIKAGESREFPFSMSFIRRRTSDQSMAEQGGVVGALGKLGKMMDSEKDNFWVTATVDVKGAALDPNDTREVKFR